MGNNEGSISKINLAITVITAVIVIGVSIRSCQIAEQSNEIAEQTKQILEQSNETAEQTKQILEQNKQILEQTYEVLYQSNLPDISAIVKTYSWAGYGTTEQLAVYNGGGPVAEFRGYAYAIMEIEFADKQTHVPLRGYFSKEETTGYTQDLILTVSRENNYSDYLLIWSDFRQAASEDGYELSLRLVYIMSEYYYCKYTERYNNECFRVYSVPTRAKEEAEAREILDSADRSEELANSWGLSLYIWGLNGRDLWNWYKAEILRY